MKNPKKHTLLMLISVISLMSITACSNMSKRDKNTAIGAGIGAVGGAILTEGSGLGTVGGAAIGGLIGHQVGKK
ncbi:osmotically-inducible lipoprotein B [Arsenophonus sp. ENCA]|nr:osmotically-inducible lipoprotein B [Arsenophonus sp. ENCA]